MLELEKPVPRAGFFYFYCPPSVAIQVGVPCSSYGGQQCAALVPGRNFRQRQFMPNGGPMAAN